MSLAFATAPAVTLAIAGRPERFPVHRVYCAGRNYAEHAKEMGGDNMREPPFFFMKPADALVSGGRFPYPPMSNDVHHEVELVVALGPGANVFGHAVGLDMTRRDLQAVAKKLSRPWDTAKGFDHSAPISEIVPSSAPLTQGLITLDVNGARRQTGDISDMIWSAAEIIRELNTLFALQAGDLIFTGTPAGVGAVKRGDRLHATVEGVASLDIEVV